jgi:peptide/nickel transport system permease protein
MSTYVLRRLGVALLTVIGVMLIVFIALRASGDVVYLLAPQDASAAEIQHLRVQLGLDRPLLVQFVRFAAALLHGDFGTSIRYHQPVLGLIASRLPATVQLVVAAFVVAEVVGIAAGVTAARSAGRWIDGLLRLIAVVGQSVPSFWLGMMAILVFAVKLGWLPTSGRAGLRYFVLPTLTLAFSTMASIMRITRSALIQNLDSEYVRFLRLKGTPERLIVWKHGLRNALIPVTALSGLQLSGLLGGTVVVETVFNWPGFGSLLVEAIGNRDYPIIQGAVFVTSLFLTLLNLAVDTSFLFIDPRVRLE